MQVATPSDTPNDSCKSPCPEIYVDTTDEVERVDIIIFDEEHPMEQDIPSFPPVNDNTLPKISFNSAPIPSETQLLLGSSGLVTIPSPAAPVDHRPIEVRFQNAPVLNGDGIEGETPEDLNQHIWKDKVKMEEARKKLKKYWKSWHKDLDMVLTTRVVTMIHTLNFFLEGDESMTWRQASLLAAQGGGHGTSYACRVHQWIIAYIKGNFRDEDLPLTKYGRFNTQALHDEDLSTHIQLHLQALRAEKNYIKADDIVKFVSSEEMQGCMGTKRTTISVWTARRWLKVNEWQYGRPKQGQYKDGHEREDVVLYWEGFVTCFAEYEHHMSLYDKEGNVSQEPILQPGEQWLFLNTHDKSTFWAHDHRKTQWCHKSDDAKPQPKDDGTSIMVSDFLSPDYG